MTVRAFPTNARVEPSPSTILSGDPVSASRHWQQMAYGANWLNGCGAMLIPYASVKVSEIPASTTARFSFYVKPRKQAIQRVWAGTAYGRTAESNTVVNVSANGGTALPIALPQAARFVAAPFLYIEDLASQSNTAGEIYFEIQSYPGHVTLLSLCCWEQWRPLLAQSSNDHGVNAASCGSRAPVYVGSYATTAESVGGVYNALADADARRVGLWHWVAPDYAPYTNNTTSFIGPDSISMPVLTRKLVSGATTGSVYWSALCKVTGGTGHVKMTSSHSSVSDDVSITNTTAAWFTPRTITVDCENMSATDGLQSSTWDELYWVAKAAAAQTVTVYAVSVWEQ